MAEERLQKFLAASGVASRRKAEALISAGRVKVNARVVTELGTKVDPEKDLVLLDGKLVAPPQAKSYYLLYKPSGCVTTASDPEGRPTAQQYLAGLRARVFPVGRLDYDAEGALVFTDDGELANRLAHPRYGHERIYLVKVRGEPDVRALERMASGVRLEDGPAHAIQVGIHERVEKNVWIRVVVGEGRYHLVKRLCEAVGLQVQRLFRPEFGGVTVEGLRAGEFRELTGAEVKGMRQRVGLVPAGSATPPPPPRRLPRAARRHGHGPPPVPGSEPVEPDARGSTGSPRADVRAARPEPEEADAARRRGEGEARRRGEGEARRRGEGEARRRGEGEARRRGEGEAPRRGEGEARGAAEGRARGVRQRPGGRNQGGSARTRVPPERTPAKKSVKKA